MRLFKLISLSALVTMTITACDDGGGFSSILDQGKSNTSPASVVCKISTVLPTTATLRISQAGGTQNFVVGGADSACNIVWKLNGVALAGTSVAQAITSTQLTPGITNTLEVTVSNGTTSDTHSWGLTKNQAPTCVVKSPATNPAAFAYTTPQALFGAGTDADGDALSNFVWKYDDVATPALFTGVSNSTLSGTATFTSQASGTHKVSLTFSDGYDTGECFWTFDMTGGCSITSTTPATASPVRMAANGGTQSYNVNINNGACVPTWTLNAVPLTGSTSTQTITSAQLAMATNILTVSITNGVSSDTKTWNILRNTPPTCSVKAPTSAPTNFAYGSSQAFTATGVDSEGDALSGFTWKFNDGANPTLFSGISTGVGTTSATFTPTVSQVGTSQKVSAVFYDGYDYGECSWTMPIITQCTVASSFPSTASYKLSQTGGSQDFTVIPNDASCAISWSLGGVSIGGTSALRTITSAMLSPGAGAANTLVATVSNGSSSATRTWNLARNQLPSCASKTPSTNPSPFIYTNHTKTFVATATDPDGDAMTSFTWKFNDSATPAGIYNGITSNASSSSMTFYPSITQVGTGQKLSAVFSDGYDTGECYWNFDVANVCTITSSSPSTATYKVANSGTATQNYVIVPSDASCTPAWTLNGSPVAGSNTIQSILGSSLNAGSGNTLSVQISNGVSSATQSWTITRNQVPTCSSKTPSSNPANFAYSTNTNVFSGTGSDADGDTLSNFVWKFNDSASPSSIYTSLSPSTPTTTQSMTFHPTATQVGGSQKVALTFTDGYDAGECSWNFGITDPNIVSLVSCNPATNPIVVATTGTASSKDLQINALNASSYGWTRGGTTVSGATSSILNINQGSGSAGLYTYVATATDVLGSSPVSCTFNVKINGLPVIGSISPAASPSAGQNWKVNWGSSMNFSVSATDPNNDTLSYTWKVDGTVQTSYLNSTTSSATFAPNFSQTLVDGNNPHTISVEVNDGTEYISQSWLVEVNKFSSDCNALFNGTVATQGGKICTLAGVPGIGGGLDPTADQTLIRLRTSKVVDDGNGNWWILDFLNNVVTFYNRSGAAIGSSGTPFFGVPGIPAGKMAVVIGNGSAGSTSDNNFNSAAKIDTGGNWGGITYDSSGPFVYVADWNNNRVLRIDGRSGVNNGKVTTVIGATPNGATPANNTSGNTDGAVGTTHYCQNPADVHLATTGGVKYLYVTCYNSHTVKRMIADISLGTYGNTYTSVGRLATGVSSCGPENGTFGPTGDARTCYPWALSSDSAGNIYYTEGTNNGASGGSRVRMINYSASLVTLFGGTTSPVISTTNGVTDTSATPLTGNTSTYNPAAATTSANKVTMWGDTPNVTSGCVELKLQAWVGTQPATLGSATTFTLTNNVASSDIYVDPSCSSQSGITGTQASRIFTMASGASEMTLYFKNTTAGASTATLGLSSALATNTGMTVSTNAANAGGANSKLALVNAPVFDSTLCQKMFVQIQNAASGISTNTFGAARVIRFYHTGVGTYYSDSSCTTPAYTVSIANGATEGAIYYKAKADIPSMQVHSFLGTSTNAGNAYPLSTYPTAPTLANSGYVNWGSTAYWQPRGLAVHEISGVVKGFFVNSYYYHRTLYVNNDSASRLIGSGSAAFTTPPYQSATVAGTGTAAYNSDGLGVASRIYNPISATMTANGNGLIISDSLNSRVRVLDLTGNGANANQLTTILGVGRIRSGNLGDTPVAATQMYFNYPRGLVVDDTNKILYTVDSSNGRIRRTNLLTGEIDTVIGNGTGAGATDGIDPTTAQMNSPRGITMLTRNGANFLVYSDTQGSSTNQNCQLRALNLTSSNGSPPPKNFYTSSISIGASKLNTVAGDYGQGCGTLGSISTPTNTRLNNPEGIAADANGNLLIANYNDHCIMKIAADGTMSVLVGNAGTCTTTAGTTSDGSDTTNAVIKFPMAVAADPRFSSYGNFFFADDPTANSSRIRYVNYSPSPVKVGSVNVPGASAPNGVVVTIWNITPAPSSAAYVNGLVANKTADGITHVCYSAGKIDSGQTGGHNVQCYDVGNGSVANSGFPDLRVGADHTSTSSVRGGTTIDSTQEGIAASNALLYAPYGLAFDSSGNLYITELSSHQIRMVRRWW